MSPGFPLFFCFLGCQGPRLVGNLLPCCKLRLTWGKYETAETPVDGQVTKITNLLTTDDLTVFGDHRGLDHNDPWPWRSMVLV